MDTGWSIFKRVREQQLFQRAPEGWIFTVGKRWPYLLNSKQRAELLAHIARINRWRTFWIILVAALFAALVAEANRLTGPGFSGWVDLFLIVTIVSNLALLFYRATMPYLQWLLLRPILAGAPNASSPPAPVPIGFWESVFAGSRNEARTSSTGWLVFACLIWGVTGVTYGYDAVTSSTNYLMAALTIYLGIQSAGALFLRLRAKQSLEPHAN